MAYVQDEDELKQGGAGGQVLSGSGGAGAGAPGQAVGTGFTNLQKYLSANEGQGKDIAGVITDQGQKAVDTARTAADTQANAWADNGVLMANQAGDTAANPYNTAATALKADPNADITNPFTSTYGGPKQAQDVQGYNDLDKAYQNVRNTATSFANDRMTQQAGLQNKYGYGSGFAALDTFLGRQDGKDKIQGWAAGVQPGSAEAQVAKVNSAIADGQKKVTDAQAGFTQTNREAKIARSMAANPQNPIIDRMGAGIADKVDVIDPYGKIKATDNDKDPSKKQKGGFY